MSKYSELVERINARPNDAPLPAEYLLDEAADAITKLEAEKAELTSLLVLCVDRVEVDDPFAKELVDKARAILAKLEAGQ